VLMFNSLTGYGYRGERPNELSGSWFQSKCLAGQRCICGTFGREDVGFDQQTPNERCGTFVRQWHVCTSGQMAVSVICTRERTQSEISSLSGDVEWFADARTAGRWPWRLAPAMERVITHPPSVRDRTMDGRLYDAMLITLGEVDWRIGTWEACARVRVEVPMEQILGVVATLRVCRDGFGHGDAMPTKGSDGSSRVCPDGDIGNDGWG